MSEESGKNVVLNGFDSEESQKLMDNRKHVQLEPLKIQSPNNTNLTVENSDHSAAPSLVASKIFKTIDLGFTDLSYSVTTGYIKKENRTILNKINGEFKAGDLTAIMGPSGAGKSSLLDILAGYIDNDNVTGRITVNNRTRDIKKFRRQSAYIIQDHDVQPLLTVMEAMHFSANLKIGDEMSQHSKKIRIKEILLAIGLYEHKRTRTGKLSGGQRKRLAIALEIVNNPPVMFFDEPTSGLDSSTSTQCISLMKKLADEGRTIICTIHQPSALLFKMFDHVYALAEGQNIYTGGVDNLVPFLKEVHLICPESYSPPDFLLEISTHDYGPQNEKLVAKTQNGKSNEYKQKNKDIFRNYFSTIGNLIPPTPYENRLTPALTPAPTTPIGADEFGNMIKFTPKKKKKLLEIDPTKWCRRNEIYSTSFWRQFTLLLMRTFLILSRDKSLTTMRILIHCSVAPLIGVLYIGIGNDAAHAFNNYRYIFFSIMFLMYTAFSSMITAFPLELPIITREHFNRWYSLRAYYVAMTLADVPIQILCTIIYVVITYFMTGQPMEFMRIGLFFTFCLLVAFVAQGLGLLVGACFDVKNAAIFGPFFISPFLIFSGFFIRFSDAHPYSHWLFHISYLKYALEGASTAIFGFDRPKMICKDVFCMYVSPVKFMKDIDMNQGDIVQSSVTLTLIFLMFRIMAFYIMSFRLRHRRLR